MGDVFLGLCLTRLFSLSLSFSQDEKSFRTTSAQEIETPNDSYTYLNVSVFTYIFTYFTYIYIPAFSPPPHVIYIVYPNYCYHLRSSYPLIFYYIISYTIHYIILYLLHLSEYPLFFFSQNTLHSSDMFRECIE